jgi:hypothetical protein
MSFTIVCGRRHNVNEELLRLAAHSIPALIIDGANAADPHRLVSYASPEVCDDIFVLETELIYKLRDAITQLQTLAERSTAEHVYVTTFDKLFNYQDEEENENVYTQVWLLLRRAAINYHITVGVRAGSLQEAYARRLARGAVWVTLP